MVPGESPADPPELTQAAKELGQAGLEVGRSAWQTLVLFRRLVAADLALSRSAFGLTLAFAGAAIALGASAWLLLMTLMVLALNATGLGWMASVAIPAVLSGVGAAVFAWRASIIFGDTGFKASRRQLARLGMAEDPEHVEEHPEQVT